MKGDFSKVGFRPERHYAQVLFQQGRPTLDSDLNAQADIGSYLDETTRIDVIGATGTPFHNAAFGFPIGPLAYNKLTLTPGRYYVNGKLVEAEGSAPIPLNSFFGLDNEPPGGDGLYIAYLDVWQRLATYLEDPELREEALGGPDTAVRVRTEWRVRIEKANFAECSDIPYPYDPKPRNLPTLTAKVTPPAASSDPCVVPAEGGFRGLENQLYRVEIHGTIDKKLTFKWSRDNGFVAANIDAVNGKTVALSTDGRDERTGFQEAALIEFCPPDNDLLGDPGVMSTNIKPIGEGLVETRDGTNWGNDVKGTVGGLARRWDGMGTVTTGVEIELEDGVKVIFAGTDFRTGDYWLIPARSASEDIIWPRDGVVPRAVPPAGIAHGYAVLALVQKAGAKWTLVSDCRKLFRPLSEETLFLFVGGDGQEAMPGFKLQAPLTVAVINGQWPLKNARVQWTDLSAKPNAVAMTDMGGTPIASGAILKTDVNGLCQVQVALSANGALLDQTLLQIEARLLDVDGKPMSEPIRFGMNASMASQVSYEPGDCASLKNQTTVQKALDRLKSLERVAYVGGDGQEAPWNPAKPTELLPLSLPLQVAVSSLCGPSDGSTVIFKAKGGQLAGKANGFPATDTFEATVVKGIATCFWLLNPDLSQPFQQATATLKGAEAVEVPSLVTFNATIELASNIRYQATCGNLSEAKADTVALALDHLCNNPNLLMVGGDGQEPAEGGILPNSLKVRAINGGGPLAGKEVVFKISRGAGKLNGSAMFSATTDDLGYAVCENVLQIDPVLEVEAALTGTSAKVVFTSQMVRGGRQSTLIIKAIIKRITGSQLLNGMIVPLGEFARGFEFDFTAPLEANCFNSGSVYITLELPTKLNSGTVVANIPVLTFFTDIVVPAGMDSSGTNGVYSPSPRLIKYLQDTQVGSQILARLCVKGDYISSLDDTTGIRTYLSAAGSPMGADRAGGSGVDKYLDDSNPPGGDFTMWFFIGVTELGARPNLDLSIERRNPIGIGGPTGGTVVIRATVSIPQAVATDTVVSLTASGARTRPQTGTIKAGETQTSILVTVTAPPVILGAPNQVDVTATVGTETITSSIEIP